MKPLVPLTISIGLLLLVVVGSVSAQYRYTDDKGVTKTTQYKLDVPKDYRDAAVWVGQTSQDRLQAWSSVLSQMDQSSACQLRLGVI